MSTIQSQVWSGNKKIIAREETIINQYRKIYNRQSIPQDKQYWTMCGNLSDNNNNINHDSEYAQIVREGLIQPHQFKGVEIDETIYNRNKQVLPNIEIYQDDFFKTLNRQANQNQFKPAIVNADLINMPEIGAIYISKIIALLSMMPGEIMLVANLVLDSPYISPTRKKQDIDRFLVNLKNQHKFNSFKHHWNFNNECYKYAGNREHSRTSMGSYIFWK
jgi:hypothetical protein